jgi:hypothetical protein
MERRLNEDAILEFKAANLNWLEDLWNRLARRLRINSSSCDWILVRGIERDTRRGVVVLISRSHVQSAAEGAKMGQRMSSLEEGNRRRI